MNFSASIFGNTLIDLFFPFGVALLPSIIWLLFFLQEDQHPEPNRLVIKVFFFGVASAGLALFLEKFFIELMGATTLLAGFTGGQFASGGIVIFAVIALIEEYVKYLAVRASVLRDPEFNEPVDAMLYMVVAALGFAAAENVLFLSSVFDPPGGLYAGIEYTARRFLGATLLHALASATLGYFLALSYFQHRRHKILTLGIGLGLGAFLHFLFNSFILIGANVFIIFVLSGVAMFIFFLFQILDRARAPRQIETGLV